MMVGVPRTARILRYFHIMDIDLNYSLALSGYREVDRLFPGSLASMVI